MKTSELAVRKLVNDLFQDVDADVRIDTKVANAICELHTNKFEQLLLERDKEVSNIVEEANDYYDPQAMGCGLEDLGITDRYEAMKYGFEEAVKYIELELKTLKKE